VPAVGLVEPFPMDTPTQRRFQGGLDDIGLTLAHTADIEAYEARRPSYR
jgi:3-isopropylmalate/(R)-2-methylmalate dehydratase small subunit